MPGEHLSELLDSIRAGLRRSLKRGVLLQEPGMQELCDRLLAIKPKALVSSPLEATRFVVIDTETTGLRAYAGDEICSISLIEMQGLEITGREFSTLVNPGREIPLESSKIHHISDEDVAEAPVIEEIFQEIAGFIGESVLVGHHIGFDIRFLNKTLQRELLCTLRHPWIDTMLLYLVHTGRVGQYSLEEVAAYSGVESAGLHTARGDALTTARVFQQLATQLAESAQPVQRLIRCQYQTGHL